MHLEGDATNAAPDALLEIWAPEKGDRIPQLTGASAIEIIPRPGGYLVRARVEGVYAVDLR
jgi:hypothetical protein